MPDLATARTMSGGPAITSRPTWTRQFSRTGWPREPAFRFGLELAFREVLAATPTEYILAPRLNPVRRRLLGNGCEIGTLADLAMEYGSFHLGRSSREHKALFGDLPSETLRKSPR